MQKKTIFLPCECSGGVKECGYAGFIFWEDGAVEICWYKNKKSKPENGTYIQNKKSLKIIKDLIK